MFAFIYQLWPCAACKKWWKKWHSNPSQHRFAKIDQPNHRSASTFLLEYWCRLWIRLVAFWNPRWKRRLCRNFTLCIFLSKANVSTCKNRSLLCDSPHVHNEVDNVWWQTQSPVVRNVWWRTQLPGVTRNWCNAETLLYILPDLVYTKRKLI